MKNDEKEKVIIKEFKKNLWMWICKNLIKKICCMKVWSMKKNFFLSGRKKKLWIIK